MKTPTQHGAYQDEEEKNKSCGFYFKDEEDAKESAKLIHSNLI